MTRPLADTMAEADDGTAPATEDAAASADVEVAEDDAGADAMAEADDGTAARHRGRCSGFG